MTEVESSSSPKAEPPSHTQPRSETKKKRNLPGMPDPYAEVIALSPKTLLTTNRFVCEICNKGFQRDQNLQLHRRGHNLPWKLRQRTAKEVRKRVYVCPEPTCVHHHPSRALGDLTGIRKHFCRKHGEKKFKCERCSKNYAVQSDRKAHMKTCGTREYRCDCGTLFSRRDSFITHRAFCDALAQESTVRAQPLMAVPSSAGDLKVESVVAGSPPPQPPTPSSGVLSPVLSIQSSELPENQTANVISVLGGVSGALSTSVTTTTPAACHISSSSTANFHGNTGVFASIFSERTSAELHQSLDPVSLSLSSFYGASSLFPPTSQNHQCNNNYIANPLPALSATALLQKAAQMGATSSNSLFLRGLGLAIPSVPGLGLENNCVKLENNSVSSGLELGPPSMGVSSGFNGSTIFVNKPATLDFLGLGMGGGEVSSRRFSAFLSSMEGGGIDITTASFGSTGETWDDPSDRKPSIL